MEYSHIGCIGIALFLIGVTFVSSLEAKSTKNLESSLKCHPALTINVTGELHNDVVEAYGYQFSDGYFSRINKTHFSVCICKVTRCLRKCCPIGHSLYNRSCMTGYEYPIWPEVYDRDLNLIYNFDYTKFINVYGNTCSDGWYPLEPEVVVEDTYYLLDDGYLYLPYDSKMSHVPVEDFCFEHVIRSPSQKPSSSTLKAMICFPSEEVEPESPLVPIGMIISIPFLLATFLVYSLPELRNLHGKNLMSHIGSLFVAYLVLVVVNLANEKIPPDLCITCGYIIQYSCLVSFFWLNVMCFDIWWAFSGLGGVKGDKKSAETKKYLMYSMYAWGCPAVISIATIVMQFGINVPKNMITPDIGIHRCFFTDEKAKLVYFYGPTAVVLLCDVAFFVLTAVKIILVKKETLEVFRSKDSRRNREASRQRYMLYLNLFLIMGVNWIMEVISYLARGPRWVWYFTDFVNSLQGVLIFALFVLRAKTKNVLANRFSSQALKSIISRESTRRSSKSQTV